ncbi:MAG: C40 family peptidase [Clostridiales bacterium]|nr:C40 family peptidase [Clostridiales bacterium]MBR6487669.1 C40 family peptidase [Clostridiales bacterium]
MVFKHNRRQHILAIAAAILVAAPIICLPIGVRAGMSPGARVAQAYANVYGIDDEDDGVTIEDWALIGSDDEMEDSTSTDKDSDKNDKKEETVKDYDDVPKYYVYQSYDKYERPEELIAPEFFTPDNTQFYSKVAGALKTKPSNDATTITSIHKGQALTRTALGDTWSKVRTESGKEGYILTSYIQDTMVKVNAKFIVWVDTGSLIVRKEPTSSGAKVTTAYKHARLAVTQVVGDKWYKVTTANGKSGYVPKSYTTRKAPPTPTPTPTPRPTRKPTQKPAAKKTSKPSYGNVNKLPKITGRNGSSIVAIAQSMLGVKYKYAGASRKGIDCSGLVMYCYAQVGIRVPHGATQIWKHSGVTVPRSSLKPGDVVCYSKGSICPHVAIYVGGNQVIHASDSKGVVCYGNIDMMKIKGYKRLIR